MILNAQIVETIIARGSISIEFGFEYNGKQGRGNIPLPLSVETIRSLLDLTGIKCWEVLKGQFIRIDVDDQSEEWEILRIGNIVSDMWLTISKKDSEDKTATE